ncbi:hypothetical protein K474DRAFT_1694975 [Panus rudis PR-1116 ss-1]|nr:hypothetical protein K474DRAFT_1694975 [Panus rudis PR-1116 ss-1]
MSGKKHGGRPNHKVYQAGKRHMELIASVSRSSGLEKDGDALRDHNIQQEYRDFIAGKLRDYWDQYPHGQTTEKSKQQAEMQSNILILFRKLREGLLSTKRSDEFALEVYETSLYLSILFESPAQATSVISHLLPGVYLSFAELPASALTASLLSLLHFLLASYPSQSRFFEHLATLPPRFIPKESEQCRWIESLAKALRTRNYARLDGLTDADALKKLVPSTLQEPTPKPPEARQLNVAFNLPLSALHTQVNALRAKARESAWMVIRSAYRELHIDPAAESPSSTHCWLYRSLALRPVKYDPKDGSSDEIAQLDTWFQEKSKAGEVRPKEGVAGRWIVCKIKI